MKSFQFNIDNGGITARKPDTGGPVDLDSGKVGGEGAIFGEGSVMK